ncbi:MAG TPA: NAD(P)-binding domain-containing protein [Candidatus Baltobacteraceae bacterium]|nr:NAD(P)-binding domain-containing protein [Candidatus Baltobacteraceae bacterium]
MNIGIVGSGDIGSTLGRLWAKKGHKVLFSFSHDKQKLERLAHECGNGSRAVTPYEAVSLSEVVLFSVPWTQIDEAHKQIGRFDGETVIDATNPYIDEQMNVQQFDQSTSSSEEVARKLEGAKVIKAFNTLRDETLWERSGQGLVIFYAGDYPQMKQQKIARLIEDAGFVPYDAGSLREGKKQEPGTERYLKELTLEQARRLVGEQPGEGNVIRGEVDSAQWQERSSPMNR